MSNQNKEHIGHGDHFQSIMKSSDDFSKVIPELANSSKKAVKSKDGKIAILFSHEKPIENIGIIKLAQSDEATNELIGGYPFFDISNSIHVTIDKIFPDESFGEGCIEGTTRSGISIDFFDTLFCLNGNRYEIGKEYLFNISAILYNIEKRTENLEFTPTSGPMKGEKFDTRKMTGFTTFDNKYHGDFTFVTPYRNFRQETKFRDCDLSIFDFVLNEPPHEELEGFKIPMLVKKDALKDIVLDDSVTGAGWLQGYLIDTEELKD